MDKNGRSRRKLLVLDELTPVCFSIRLYIERFRNMYELPRRQEILKLLSMLRHVTVGDLSERLKVSEVTIRKDLTMLEESGCLIRTRGGAQIAEDSRLLRTVDLRQQDHVEEKRRIAEKARELIREGETIYLDAGTTCSHLAAAVKHMSLRVVTNSIDVIIELADAPEISLFTLGGSYRREAGSFIGPIPISTLDNFQIETCFIGTTGFTLRGQFSAQNIIESQLKQKVLSVSHRKIILADSSKAGKTAFSVFARTGDADMLITDRKFTDEAALQALGLEVLFA